jgi:hypothetical protein
VFEPRHWRGKRRRSKSKRGFRSKIVWTFRRYSQVLRPDTGCSSISCDVLFRSLIVFRNARCVAQIARQQAGRDPVLGCCREFCPDCLPGHLRAIRGIDSHSVVRRRGGDPLISDECERHERRDHDQICKTSHAWEPSTRGTAPLNAGSCFLFPKNQKCSDAPKASENILKMKRDGS